MIVKMKRMTLLVAEGHRERMLQELRRLGVVHIKHIQEPSAEEIGLVQGEIVSCETALNILNNYDGASKISGQAVVPDDIASEAQQIIKAYDNKQDCLNRSHDIDRKIEWYKPWGDFDPGQINELKEKGIYVKLYSLRKAAFKGLVNKDVHLISEDRTTYNVALITQDPAQILAFEEQRVPDKGLSDLLEDNQRCKQTIKNIDKELGTHASTRDAIKRYMATQNTRQAFLEAMHGMKAQDGLAYLQGYCPEDKLVSVKSIADKAQCGYMIEEPGAQEDVPTLVRNPRWIDIISPVFKFMNTTPGYKEYDISVWFLVFFSIFFAMLIGDAGYGLIFAGLTFFAHKKFKDMPAKIFHLLYLLSFATIVWGAVTGTWFGSEAIARLPFLSSIAVERISSFADSNQSFMIYICFCIGVVHLTIAHLILACRVLNSPRLLSETGWILILWGLFFAAGTLVLNKPFPEVAKYLLMAGIVLVLLFANFQRNFIKGVLVTLTRLPLSFISSFSDIVSYLRLFAVGYASVAVAGAFNNMVLSLGFHNIVATFLSAMILVFGHTLNITLGLMAVIVHGIRLNMLEFSGQMGMEWSGIEYKPFTEEGAGRP